MPHVGAVQGRLNAAAALESAPLAWALINEGHLNRRSEQSATRAKALGTGFVSRLPASPLLQWANCSDFVVILMDL